MIQWLCKEAKSTRLEKLREIIKGNVMLKFLIFCFLIITASVNGIPKAYEPSEIPRAYHPIEIPQGYRYSEYPKTYHPIEISKIYQ